MFGHFAKERACVAAGVPYVRGVSKCVERALQCSFDSYDYERGESVDSTERRIPYPFTVNARERWDNALYPQ